VEVPLLIKCTVSGSGGQLNV